MIEELQKAIKEKRHVLLLRNKSTSTPDVRDREVEPEVLTEDLTRLSAMGADSGEPRTYNFDRMQGVKMLTTDCRHPPSDRRPDIFGIAATDWQPVELLLTERTCQLLVREYPAVLPYCLPAGEELAWPHRFRGQVRGLEGIGRFVMGLSTEVRVVGPKVFRTFVQEKSARALW